MVDKAPGHAVLPAQMEWARDVKQGWPTAPDSRHQATSRNPRKVKMTMDTPAETTLHRRTLPMYFGRRARLGTERWLAESRYFDWPPFAGPS